MATVEQSGALVVPYYDPVEQLRRDWREESTPHEDLVRDLGVICLKRTMFGEAPYPDREQRIDRLTLPNDHKLTALVTEPHSDAMEDPNSIELVLLFRGFGEIPSADGTSANNLHDGYALSHPDKRVVSVDRHGLSQYDSPMWPWDAVRVGFENGEAAAKDLLEVAIHYADGNRTTLVGTSAGLEDALEVADQNQKSGNSGRLDIAEEIVGVVSCAVLNDSPSARDKNVLLTSIKIAAGFAAHAQINMVQSLIKNPKDTLKCARIAMTYLEHPWLLPVLPPQFLLHMRGTESALVRDVTKSHVLRLIEGESDVLNSKRLGNPIKEVNPDRITIDEVANEGHISLPVNTKKTLHAIDANGEAPPHTVDIIEYGMSLADLTVQKIGDTALAQLPRIGRQLLSPIRKLTV